MIRNDDITETILVSILSFWGDFFSNWTLFAKLFDFLRDQLILWMSNRSFFTHLFTKDEPKEW